MKKHLAKVRSWDFGELGTWRQAAAYAALCLVFWGLVWVMGGEASTHGGQSTVRVEASGALINLALFIAAWRGSETAKSALIAVTIICAVVIASIGIVPFALLAALLVAQAILLISIGWTGASATPGRGSV